MSLDTITASVSVELGEYARLPRVLVGVSLGALLALGVASRTPGAASTCVLVAQSPAGLARLHPGPVSDGAIRALLASGGAVDERALADADVVGELVRRVRADFSIVGEGDLPAARERCRADVSYVCGDADPLVPVGELAKWHGFTEGAVNGSVVRGGHFAAFDPDNSGPVAAAFSVAVRGAMVKSGREK